MKDMRSFGKLLDDYLAEYPEYETVFIYHDKSSNPHIVVTNNTGGWDYTDVFSEAIDLRQEIADKKKEVGALRASIRSLEKDKRSIEAAIKKLVNHRLVEKGTENE